MDLLSIDADNETEWFKYFNQLNDDLTKCLVLVALMTSQYIIKDKEVAQVKKYLLTATERKLNEIIQTFLRTRSLFSFRSELRGHMGLPRTRK